MSIPKAWFSEELLTICVSCLQEDTAPVKEGIVTCWCGQEMTITKEEYLAHMERYTI